MARTLWMFGMKFFEPWLRQTAPRNEIPCYVRSPSRSTELHSVMVVAGRLVSKPVPFVPDTCLTLYKRSRPVRFPRSLCPESSTFAFNEGIEEGSAAENERCFALEALLRFRYCAEMPGKGGNSSALRSLLPLCRTASLPLRCRARTRSHRLQSRADACWPSPQQCCSAKGFRRRFRARSRKRSGLLPVQSVLLNTIQCRRLARRRLWKPDILARRFRQGFAQVL
jgi:hypothetical protein